RPSQITWPGHGPPVVAASEMSFQGWQLPVAMKCLQACCRHLGEANPSSVAALPGPLLRRPILSISPAASLGRRVLHDAVVKCLRNPVALTTGGFQPVPVYDSHDAMP